MLKSIAKPTPIYSFPRHFLRSVASAALLIFAALLLFSANACQAFAAGSGAPSRAAGHQASRHGIGSIAAWGDDAEGQTTVPAGLSGKVTAIAGAIAHSLALKSDGTVAAWGDDIDGETDVPAGLSGVTAVAARCPPAEKPSTPMRLGSIFHSALERTVRTARWTSPSSIG